MEPEAAARLAGRGEQRKSAKLQKKVQELQLVQVDDIQPRQDTSSLWVAIWVGSAVAFGAALYALEGPVKSAEFFAGYILEQSLSVDNLFVFVLVFNYFKTPPSGQTQVLGYGIATAAVLRLVLIVAGVELVESWKPILGVFAAILIASSYKLLTTNDEEAPDLGENKFVQFFKKTIKSSDRYDGNNFFTLQDGVKVATPLLLTLIIIELSDVVFAVDSIPAVFGVTLDPFIVYTSNIFAILSLRSLYTFTATAMSRLQFLDKAVATVLGFIGCKMLAGLGGYEVSTNASLTFVGVVLGTGIAASMLFPAPPVELTASVMDSSMEGETSGSDTN